MVADFMFCKRSRMKGFEDLVRKAKLQTASKHQNESLKSIETVKTLNIVKHGARIASLYLIMPFICF